MKILRTVLIAGLIAGGVLLLGSETALAQSFSLDMGAGGGDGGSTTGRVVELVALMTVLSVVPGLLVTVTSFTRIVVVLSFLRTALGIQQTPPNTVLLSLALFLTAFVMAPTLQKSYDEGIRPLIEEKLPQDEALKRAAAPFHTFMVTHVRDLDLNLFMNMGKVPSSTAAADMPYQVLIPAFMISELRRAFEIGFMLFLPFLIIDIVVASLVMSMGMVSLPPSIISLPFKIIFFVLIDGWYLVCGALVQSFGPG